MKFFTSDHHFFHKNIMKYEAKYRPFSSTEEMNEALITHWNETVKPDDEVYYLGDFALGSGPSQAWKILERLNGIKYLIRGNHDHQQLETRCFEWAHDEYELSLDLPHQEGELSIRLCHYPYVDADLLHMNPDDVLQFASNAPRLDEQLTTPLTEILESQPSYHEQRAILTDLYGLVISDLDQVEAQPLKKYLTRALKRFTWRQPRPDGRWLLHGHVHGLWRCKPAERMVNVSVEAWGLKPVSETEIAQLIWQELHAP